MMMVNLNVSCCPTIHIISAVCNGISARLLILDP